MVRASENPDYPPRPVRVASYEPCTIARVGGKLCVGALLNLSNDGFCVEASQPLEPSECVEIRVLGLGRIRGIVRWSISGRAGGLLDTSRDTVA